MNLEMRGRCERCGGGVAEDRTAFICSHECTFFEGCAVGMDLTCPNCGGELARWPRSETA